MDSDGPTHPFSPIIQRIRVGRSLTDGGMGANRNAGTNRYFIAPSLTDGGMGANRNNTLIQG